MKQCIFTLCAIISSLSLSAQHATVKETEQVMGTYAFDDPDPVAKPENLYYPYFRFDGFTNEKTDKKWKTVELENDYIRVTLFPEIGGKIWGAVDKTSGKEFIYTNHVVKFRDIAMRGPWVSGGIEFNFGIIGHAPTSATPVDYIPREKEDGSVSCYISAIDFITRTTWTVEVNVPKDKAYFTTHTTWYNSSSLDQPYYQWMNAGYKAAGNTRFCYPGTNYIGHGGDLHTFPVDDNGRDLSWYKNNAFESSKSYHVLGYYNDFYGAYWHDDDFGSVHHSAYDEKLGMKIFLWSQARDGAIWEDLLTDTDGQYVELQSGRMYNQPATNSARTPFKHTAFQPGATDEWTEYWFPVKETKGIVQASHIGALNVLKDNNRLTLYFSPTQELSVTLKVYSDEKEIISELLQTKTLQTWCKSYPLDTQSATGKIKVVIGNNDLVYSEQNSDKVINRPKEIPDDFDWNSVYGLYTSGEQWMNQKMYDKAEADLLAALSKDKYFAPALIRLSSLYYREGRYDEALQLCRSALSLNAYDGEANYLYGLCNIKAGHYTDAKDGFSVAAYSPAFRTAAYAKLAAVFIREQDWNKAISYAQKSLQYNTENLDALQELLVCYRKTGQKEKATQLIEKLSAKYPLNHVVSYEKHMLQPSLESLDNFNSSIRNELPEETYMEIAGWYESIGCEKDAINILSYIPVYPMACYKQSWLLHKAGEEAEAIQLIKNADILPANQVFPFRPENREALAWIASHSNSWKPAYYYALICHANHDKAKALEIMDNCGETDYIPFYLYRASLKKGTEQLNDLQKAARLGNDWRTGLNLIKYYAGTENWKEANITAARYYKLFPENYVIGLQYAKTLCETEQYARAILLLRKIQVLPNEGAYAGRGIYRDANLYEAMAYIKKHKYEKALTSIEESKQWIENLGVGKPYEDQIDYRVENFLSAKALVNQPVKASLFLERVTKTPVKNYYFESTNLLVALALSETGQKEVADKWVSLWKTQYPSSPIIEWCTAIYQGDTALAAKILNTRTEQSESTPWENINIDRNFGLLTKYFSE